ncbi:hypothetical protein L210DRAFT_879429, partial [Boletus edulis BED1]
LSSAPRDGTKWSLRRKPAPACLFCREMKVVCDPPQPESKDKSCNQCTRKHLKCIYPHQLPRGK